MGGRNPAWGPTGGVGEVGEKLHGVEMNPRVGSVLARGGREGLLRGAGAPAATVGGGGGGPVVGATASGLGSTGGGQGS